MLSKPINTLDYTHSVSSKLLAWYQTHQRDLPWRNTRDPYKIWLSEIILQQTRVQQGQPYYERFVETFPTVEDLAAASEQEVLRLWQGLGYYSRARNLHACAKMVVNELNALFPDNFKDLLKLKGVGNYTAAAIASFAFGEAVPVVDGNVYRVLARLFGINTDIAQPSAYKEFAAVAQELIDLKQPDLFNQAIMEFGALHCTPQKPLCLYCPLQSACYAFEHQKQKELPVKKGKIKIKHRYFHYFILHAKEGKIFMRRRQGKDIWQGLFDFYVAEASSFLEIPAIKDPLLQQLLAQNSVVVKESAAYKHQLTHQLLHVKFFELAVSPEGLKGFLEKQTGLEGYSMEEINDLPKPVLITNYLQKLNF
jgi:A/G-specific adenine glycosylase